MPVSFFVACEAFHCIFFDMPTVCFPSRKCWLVRGYRLSRSPRVYFAFQVLNPCSMTFSYSTPASDKGGQDIAIYLEAMRFDFSPGLLATVTNVIKELTGQREVCFVV